MGMITSIQVQYDRAGYKRGRQMNILADQALFEFCELRKFELQFTGEKLQCITQAEKSRLMAAKTQAKQKQEASRANQMTYGQWKTQGRGGDYGKRPRK
jgi:hypothetical protein